MKNLHYPLIFFILSLTLIFSCKDSLQEKNNQEATKISIELIDSLTFEMLADPILCSVSDNAEMLMFYDWSSGRILVYHKDGQLISEIISKKGNADDPGFFNDLPSFIGNDSINMNGFRGYYIYNLAGEFIDKVKNPSERNIGANMPIIGKTAKSFISKNKERILLT